MIFPSLQHCLPRVLALLVPRRGKLWSYPKALHSAQYTNYWRYDMNRQLTPAMQCETGYNGVTMEVQWSYNRGIMERYPLDHLWPLFLWWRWRFTEEHCLFLHEFAHQQPRKLSCTCSTFWSHLLDVRCTCLGVPTGIWTLQWKLIQYFGVLEWLRS